MINKSFIQETKNFSKKLKNPFVKKIIAFDEINSTNLKAKELAKKGADEGTIIVTRIQKKGRGRFHRSWESPEGGLYFSIILRPKNKPDKITLLPLIASLAVCKTINEFELGSNIKWPNDVHINGKKVAGILIEIESKNKKVEYVVVGIGINLNTNISNLSSDFDATSLYNELNEKVVFYDFFEKLLNNLSKLYSDFSKEKYDNILTGWKNNSDTLGKKVKIVNFEEFFSGTAIDVDESGFLLIDIGAKNYKKITSGDCFYIE